MRQLPPLLMAGSLMALAACAPRGEVSAPPPPTTPAAPAPAGATMAHFRCETGELLAVRFDRAANTATILDAGGDRVLTGEPAASGFLYQSPFASLRGKGDDLQYAIGRRAASACVAIPEAQHRILSQRKADGAVWRAIGQEPGWTVDLFADGGMQAVLDYGRVRRNTPPVASTREGAGTSWSAQTESGSMRLTLQPLACADTMSGDRYWFTATLVVDGRTMKGCAQPLG